MPGQQTQPVSQAQGSLMGQTAGGFLGVNLRRDRVTLADQDCAKAINADFHTQPGTIVLRLGRQSLFNTPLTDLVIRRVAKINNHRYQVAAQSVYRDQVTLINSLLSPNHVTTLVGYRPLNDLSTYAFIADDNGMWKDDGTTRTSWGLLSPAVAPVVAAGAAGGLTGNYSVRYTYVRKVAGAVAAESNPSPASNTVTLAAQQLSITTLHASSDPQVTNIRIYRTTAGNSVYLFDQDVPASSASATSTQADGLLGTAVDLTGNLPPPHASWAVVFQDSMFLCRDALNPHYLWYSKRFLPESFPSSQFLEIGNPDDPLQCAVEGPGILGVFTKKTKYRVNGNILGGFEYQQSFSVRGTLAFNAVLSTPRGIVFPATDGVFVTNMLSEDINFAQEILPIFLGETVNGFPPINWSAASVMSAGIFKERYYLAYPSGTSTLCDTIAVYSLHTKKWYFYNHINAGTSLNDVIQSFFYETDTDQFTAGGQDGFVYVMETGTTILGGPITLTVETKDFQVMGPISIPIRRLFLFVKVEFDTLGDVLNVDLYVDDQNVQTYQLSNNGRTTRLLPTPQGTMGFRWRMVFRYVGTSRIRIYDASALFLPLEVA